MQVQTKLNFLYIRRDYHSLLGRTQLPGFIFLMVPLKEFNCFFKKVLAPTKTLAYGWCYVVYIVWSLSFCISLHHLLCRCDLVLLSDIPIQIH